MPLDRLTFALPRSDARFNFATREACEKALNKLEDDRDIRIQALGCYRDNGADEKIGGNCIEYLENEEEIGAAEASPRRKLKLVEVPANALADTAAGKEAWEAFILQDVDDFDFVDRAQVFYNDETRQVVLLRESAQPLKKNAAGLLTTTTPGWTWLKPRVENDDLVLENVRCTWFGGPNDHQDSGETSSGRVNTRLDTSFLGAALPMNGFSNSPNTAGSPLPRFKWMTPLEVETVGEDSPDFDPAIPAGRKLTVALIDLGPAKFTQKAVDLTERAFNALGAASSRGVIRINLRIRNWRTQLDRRAVVTEAAASSSVNKPLISGSPEKERPAPKLSGWKEDDFRTLIRTLKLSHLSADELLPYFARTSNKPPPPAIWRNFVPVLLILDALREKLGAPLRLTSTYRHPDLNRQLDGAAGLSQHMAFRAADIQVDGVPPTAVHAALRQMRGNLLGIPKGADFAPGDMTNKHVLINANTPFNLAGLQIKEPTASVEGSFVFSGGLGLYETFVHVDCRGIDSNWT